jgi:hypothetical protein
MTCHLSNIKIQRACARNLHLVFGFFPPLILSVGRSQWGGSRKEDKLIVDLADGRSISVPLAWFPRLLHASSMERENWEIAGPGYGLHWPDIDEDLSVEGLLRGAPAPQSKALVR